MTVTREFARDHGLDVPDGYRRQEEKLLRRNRQLSGYDGVKQRETGISHEERMTAVTGAWRRSYPGQAFVNALEDLGYVLARGRNERRLVLVDIYGHTTALTRLIDDPAVKAKHVRELLGPDYAPDTLPSAEQAQGLAAFLGGVTGVALITKSSRDTSSRSSPRSSRSTALCLRFADILRRPRQSLPSGAGPSSPA